jgi:hypothetical protein
MTFAKMVGTNNKNVVLLILSTQLILIYAYDYYNLLILYVPLTLAEIISNCNVNS